jgi:hypothetical protein
MRPLIAALACCYALLASDGLAQVTFPYKAYVGSEDVYVRSGPGQNYYPTDKLKRGQEVEVYRHDPGGWCAIRPVPGSFTWVSARFLKPTEDHLAVVTEEDVSARVGSRFSDIRDVIQVRLHKGEVVEILDPPPRGAVGPSGWFKIAPPSGEFRWVSGKYIDAEYPRDGIRRRHDDRRAPEGPDADRAAGPSRHRDHDRSEAADDSLRARSARPRSLSAEEFRKELEGVELELSVMVIEEPAAWSFDVLRERTDLLMDQAQTAVERGRARVLADKIARFDDIRRRAETVVALRERTDRAGRLYARLRPRDDGSAAKQEIDGRYDGVGHLTQVVSPKVGAPRYALMDQSGDVRCYVTPAPGVHLQDYVGREVGVIGTRGYMPEQRASHIMVRHVTPLEGQTLLR